MIDESSIVPGQLVHGTNGAVGTVERLDAGSTEETPGAIVVRSADEQRRYRIPLDLVRRIKREQDRDIVVLRAGADDLDRYLIERPMAARGRAGSDSQVSTGAASSQGNEPILRVPVRIEELSASTRQVQIGTVHIHKGVKTTDQTLLVPVTREETIIEHIAPEDYDDKAPLAPDEIVIPVIEERLVVEKRAVVKEYIRVRKNRIVEEREVTAPVRSEFVEVSAEPTGGVDTGSRPLYRVEGPTA
ncbi:MAG: hypothetical protein JWO59_1003 [Chloroflexi bacterium]|nr:hypothetical protein [Chloroflexota bacterium]MDB5075257.1 hypothetical protein [Chloroflexota bacterium]